MCLSAAPRTAPCGPTDSKLFVLGPAGDSQRNLAGAGARYWACRRQGQMGQQMGKQAELPLICSTESLATPKEEEGGRETMRPLWSADILSTNSYNSLI